MLHKLCYDNIGVITYKGSSGPELRDPNSCSGDLTLKVYFKTSKSIFKTPQGNNGMVGVGTNGHGDRGMTENRESARYNARHLAPNQ